MNSSSYWVKRGHVGDDLCFIGNILERMQILESELQVYDKLTTNKLTTY